MATFPSDRFTFKCMNVIILYCGILSFVWYYFKLNSCATRTFTFPYNYFASFAFICTKMHTWPWICILYVCATVILTMPASESQLDAGPDSYPKNPQEDGNRVCKQFWVRVKFLIFSRFGHFRGVQKIRADIGDEFHD